MGFSISYSEYSNINTIPYLPRCLYFSIASKSDRGISLSTWGTLAKDLFTKPCPGISGTGEPSKSAIRRAANFLKKIGLISWERSGNKNEFSLLKNAPENHQADTLEIKPETPDGHAIADSYTSQDDTLYISDERPLLNEPDDRDPSEIDKPLDLNILTEVRSKDFEEKFIAWEGHDFEQLVEETLNYKPAPPKPVDTSKKYSENFAQSILDIAISNEEKNQADTLKIEPETPDAHDIVDVDLSQGDTPDINAETDAHQTPSTPGNEHSESLVNLENIISEPKISWMNQLVQKNYNMVGFQKFTSAKKKKVTKKKKEIQVIYIKPRQKRKDQNKEHAHEALATGQRMDTVSDNFSQLERYWIDAIKIARLTKGETREGLTVGETWIESLRETHGKQKLDICLGMLKIKLGAREDPVHEILVSLENFHKPPAKPKSHNPVISEKQLANYAKPGHTREETLDRYKKELRDRNLL